MARIFIDGFESGGIDLWDAVNNATITSAAGLDMDGGYCLDLNSGNEYAEKNIDAVDEMYFAFKYHPTSDSSSEQILTLYNGSVPLVNITRVPDGEIEAFRGESDLLATGSITPIEDATCLIEIHVSIHDSSGRIEVKVNGILDIDFTGDTKPDANTQFDKVRLGHGSRTGDYSNAYYDNFIMDDAAWIGDTKIQAIAPSAGGNAANWSPSTGANFQCVDEIPASDVDYVSVNTNNVIDTYAMSNMTGSPDTVKCIQVQSRTESDGTPTPTNLQLVIRPDTTDYVSSSKAVAVSPKGLYHIWMTNPEDSQVWETSDVNGLEVGIKSIA